MTGLRPARRCVGRPEKFTARALGRVLARNVAAGRSVEYPELLAETAAELAAMDERLKRDARALRRAREQVLDAQLRIPAARSRGRRRGDAGAGFLGVDMAMGPPRWHPEHPENDF